MKKYFIPGVVSVFVIILILLGISRYGQTQSPDDTSPTPTLPQNSDQITTPTRTPSEVSPTAPNDQRPNISVDEPRANDVVGRSFIVQGEARVFENVVSYRVRNQKTNAIIAQGTTMADSPDVGQFGKYTITVTIPERYQLATNDIIILEVYQASAKDGSDADKVTLPLKFTEQ